MRVVGPPRVRFEAKFVPVPESGCWLWEGAVIAATGYGRFGMGHSRVEYAHRASWSIYKGDIPYGMFVCHKCDTRTCVNPDHLFLGTAKDNMRDCSNKGRLVVPDESYHSRETHQVAKLTNDQVRRIRSGGESPTRLAREFGVTVRTVFAAKSRETFRDI